MMKSRALSLVLKGCFATAVCAAALLCAAWFYQEDLLPAVGGLVHVDEPVERPADAVVILRGDSGHERLLKGVDLYRRKMARAIVLPRALEDNGALVLARAGAVVPSRQEQLRNILEQLGVPASDIILDEREPGGGTLGEARRVRALALSHPEWKSLAVVTSWYHTARAKRIYSHVFSGYPIRLSVVSAGADGPYGPDGWWKQRYRFLSVVSELAKNVLFMVRKAPLFDDAPGVSNATGP